MCNAFGSPGLQAGAIYMYLSRAGGHAFLQALHTPASRMTFSMLLHSLISELCTSITPTRSASNKTACSGVQKTLRPCTVVRASFRVYHGHLNWVKSMSKFKHEWSGTRSSDLRARQSRHCLRWFNQVSKSALLSQQSLRRKRAEVT